VTEGADNITDHWLRQFVKANPSKSIYGFTLNRKRPGHFNLCFLANINAAIQTWVRYC
jgi:transcription elongation factor SPT6